MKKLGFILIAAAIVSLLGPTVALAQDDDNQIVMGVYYRCNQAKESRADEIHNQVVAPIVQFELGTPHRFLAR